MAAEDQSSKRQRLEQITPAPGSAAAQQQQQSPWVTALFQVPAGLPREPSPGAMHGCRIAAWYDESGSSSTYGSVLASGRHVFWSQLLVQQQQLQTEQHGKEGVLLPLRLSAPAVTQLQQLPQHAGEVQVSAVRARAASLVSRVSLTAVLSRALPAAAATLPAAVPGALQQQQQRRTSRRAAAGDSGCLRGWQHQQTAASAAVRASSSRHQPSSSSSSSRALHTP